jgi:hypothetical protein
VGLGWSGQDEYGLEVGPMLPANSYSGQVADVCVGAVKLPVVSYPRNHVIHVE